MTPVIAIWLALFAAQVAAPAAPASPASPQASGPTAMQAAPKPNPDANGKYHVGDSVTAPQLLYKVDPEFTKEAKKRKINGITIINLIVDTDGNPTNVHVQHSMADSADKKHRAAALSLDQAALDAVKQYKFAPATLQGKPVPVELNVEVNFKIF
jgi:TonB family protein